MSRLRDLSGEAPAPSLLPTIGAPHGKLGAPTPPPPTRPSAVAAAPDARLAPLPDSAIQGNWTQSQR